MSSGSKTDRSLANLDMKGEKDGINCKYYSRLLELSAEDDITAFISEVEGKGFHVNESSFWYGRRFGSKKMGLEERTPLLISAMYGSVKILNYVIGSGKVDINKAYGLDGVTALHCAAAGGSSSMVEVVKLLIDSGGDINSIDANGNKPLAFVGPSLKSISNSRRKTLEMLLKGDIREVVDQEQECMKSQSVKEGAEKKEYPIDVSLPDINTGLYGSDEFRMYSFKVKPCSRAYSHDWTECPFVHPGENARRRDPSKYNYSCVPCPEFKKGTCAKGDSCEYAHGVFESWLHPAQYRTRLCKDERGCSRKICFFAHKVEELRPLYASTGSAIPSPKSMSSSSMDMASLSPLALGSSSTAPMSPSAVCSSPMASSMWQNNNHTPPTMQLSGSRLKATFSARDLDLEMERLGLESIRTRQQLRQQLIDEMAGLSSPSSWSSYDRLQDLKPTNLDDAYGSYDQSLLSHLQCLSPRISASSTSQLQSPTGHQPRQNLNPLWTSYPSNVSSNPRARKSSALGFDTSAAVAAAVMNSRSSAFAKRSQSFIDRGAMNYNSSVTAAASSPKLMSSSNTVDWGSPTGKLDWGFNSNDADKFRKSASFALRNSHAANADAPDLSWANSSANAAQRHGSIHEMMPSWIDQMYIEQEQMVVA